MARVDLTVRGGGIFGLSVAWEAARRGAKVRLIEAVAIGAGSSGGTVGALSPHTPETWNEKKAFQLDSLFMAQGFWDGVEAVSGQSSGYGRVGRLQVLADAAAIEFARVREVDAVTLWQGRADWRVIKATGAAWEPRSPSGWLVHDTLSARLHPVMAAAALVAAIQAKGGDVVIGDAPDEGAVVWATGLAGLQELNVDLGRFVGGGVKGQSLAVRAAVEGPQIFVDGLHIVPHSDGTVGIGSTSENTWEGASTTDERLEALQQRAVAALPILQGGEVVTRWAGVRPRPKSLAPLLGAWPGRPGQFVANGGFKIGFGMAPKVAAVMADLVLDGRDAIAESFRLR